MYRLPFFLLPALLLSACLVSPRPIFDETNSLAPEDSPAVAAFRAAAEAFQGDPGFDVEATVFPDNGVVRVVAEEPRLVLQNESSEGGNPWDTPTGTLYYMVRLTDAGKPDVCLADTARRADIEALGRRFGVAIGDVPGGPENGTTTPMLEIDGDADAVRTFLVAVFTEGPYACDSGVD